MLHQQSLMFVEYLHKTDEQAFDNFVVALLRRGSFAQTFAEHFGKDVNGAWSAFLDSLEREAHNRAKEGEKP